MGRHMEEQSPLKEDIPPPKSKPLSPAGAGFHLQGARMRTRSKHTFFGSDFRSKYIDIICVMIIYYRRYSSISRIYVWGGQRSLEEHSAQARPAPRRKSHVARPDEGRT